MVRGRNLGPYEGCRSLAPRTTRHRYQPNAPEEGAAGTDVGSQAHAIPWNGSMERLLSPISPGGTVPRPGTTGASSGCRFSRPVHQRPSKDGVRSGRTKATRIDECAQLAP